MPPAARVGDMHTCPMVTGVVPHVGGPILPPGCPTVLIGAMPAARVTDMATCVGPPDVIAIGSPTVLIGNLMAGRMGDMTAHGGVIVIGCPTVQIGIPGAGAAFGPGPMSPAAATALFNVMAHQGDIAFAYPVDGCYARAQLMADRMQQMGATPGKVWSFAGSSAVPLWVNTTNHPDGQVAWGYHVAPTIPVQGTDGVVHNMVVDPSLFDHPVTISEWQNAQHDHPRIVETKLGESPLASGAGSGYWPAPDPLEGPDEHARETMEEYKHYEGTRGPP